MFKSVLRARWLINTLDGKTSAYRQHYTDKNLLLNNNEWRMVSEFEAMMSFTNKLAMMSQRQYPGEIAFPWYNIAECHFFLSMNSKLKCIDVNNPDKAYESWKLWDELPRKKVTRKDLLPSTITFITRLLDEFLRYFPDPDTDMLIAMNLHPLMHWQGFV